MPSQNNPNTAAGQPSPAGPASSSTSGGTSGGAPKSLRRQVLLGVNFTLLLALAAYLALDYSDRLSTRMRDKSELLRGQASALVTLLSKHYQNARTEYEHYVPGNSELALLRRNQAPDPLLKWLNDVQVRLRPTRFSTGPGLIAQVQDQLLIPVSMRDGQTDLQLTTRFDELADDNQKGITVNGRYLVIGSAQLPDLTILVWQDGTDILNELRRDLLWRILALACIGMGITAVVNIILLRLVNKPIQHLVTVMRRIAKGELGVRAKPGNTTETHFLAIEINAMTQALEDADANRRAQMDKAQAIQENLRPSPELVKNLKAAYKQLTANEVGGDCVDLKRLQDGSVLLCIGDVTGHGVPAAMGAAMLKALIDSSCDTGRSPGLILQAINRGFASVTLEGDFASFFIAWVSPDRSILRYASAGHEPAYLIDPEGKDLRKLDSTGPLLGLDKMLECQEIEMAFRPGDRLVILTDGLPETMDPAGKLFGRARIRELLCRFRPQPCEQYIRAVMEAAEEYRRTPTRQDDMTIIVIDA
jgi:phosphoserine phosphatase RsbU/P